MIEIAIKHSNIEATKELLDEDITFNIGSLYSIAIEQDKLEVLKLLRSYD
jgi:hypothetical protein